MKNSVRIGHIPSIELRTLFIIYAGVFTTLWTFIEPLGLFGVFGPEVTSIGLYGYLLLLIVALLLSFLPVKIYRNWLFEKQDSLHIIFESSSDGDIRIKTQKNIQVFDLTRLLVDFLLKGDAKERVIHLMTLS